MLQRNFSISPQEFPLEDLWLAMGYKGSQPDDAVRSLTTELLERLCGKASLKYICREVDALKANAKEIILDGIAFASGPIIGSYLNGMTSAYVFIATAGRECADEMMNIKKENDLMLDFIADSIGSVLAEISVSRLETELAHNATVSLPYSPGYCGWDVREQKKFFSLFPDEPCGVTVNDSCLMTPEKSISGFFALGKELVRKPYHCKTCRNINCYKRRNA